jgi:phage tail-like protein
MTTDSTVQPSSLLDYLPAIYRDDPFVGRFLSAFEQVLIGESAFEAADEGKATKAYKSLEATIASIAILFDPMQTPEDFLPWLADWTAFTMRADLDLDQQRWFISKIIQLYKRRGTKQNLQELLTIFTKGRPKVIEAGGEEFQVGVSSTIGEDTWLGGSPAHYFQVTISLSEAKTDIQGIQRKQKITRDLIELEKPAHTFYDLYMIFPSMQIGVQSTLGVDTLLGTIPEE